MAAGALGDVQPVDAGPQHRVVERRPLPAQVRQPDRAPARVPLPAVPVRRRPPGPAAATPRSRWRAQSTKSAPALLGPPTSTRPGTVWGTVTRPGISSQSSVTTQITRVAPKMASTSPGSVAPATSWSQRASMVPPATTVSLSGRVPAGSAHGRPRPASGRHLDLRAPPARPPASPGGRAGRRRRCRWPCRWPAPPRGRGWPRPGTASSRRRPAPRPPPSARTPRRRASRPSPASRRRPRPRRPAPHPRARPTPSSPGRRRRGGPGGRGTPRRSTAVSEGTMEATATPATGPPTLGGHGGEGPPGALAPGPAGRRARAGRATGRGSGAAPAPGPPPGPSPSTASALTDVVPTSTPTVTAPGSPPWPPARTGATALPPT